MLAEKFCIRHNQDVAVNRALDCCELSVLGLKYIVVLHLESTGYI